MQMYTFVLFNLNVDCDGYSTELHYTTEADVSDVDKPFTGGTQPTPEEPKVEESTDSSSSTWHSLAIPAGVLVGIILLIIIIILLVWFACPGICHRGQLPPIHRFHSYIGQDVPPSYQESVLNPRPIYIIDRSTNVTNNQPRIVLVHDGQMPYIEEESIDHPAGVARAYSLGTNRQGRRKGARRSRSRRQTIDGSRMAMDYSSYTPPQRDSVRRHIEGYRRHSLVNVYLHHPAGRRRSSVRRSSSLHIPSQYRHSVMSNRSLHRHSIASDMSQPPGYYEYIEHPAIGSSWALHRTLHRHSIASDMSQPPGYFEYPIHQLVVPPRYDDIILTPLDVNTRWPDRRGSYQHYETTRV